VKKRTSRSPCSDNSDQDTGKLVGFTILILSLCVVGASEYQAATRGRKHLIKHKASHPGAELVRPNFGNHVGFSVCLVLAGGVFLGQSLILTHSVFRLTLGLMNSTFGCWRRPPRIFVNGRTLKQVTCYTIRPIAQGSSPEADEGETLGSGRSCYCYLNIFLNSDIFALGSSVWKRGMGP